MHGLYLMWWVQEKHVPVSTVAVLLATGDLAITVLEIPTGWLADRYGHRASLIAGSIAQVAGMLLAWLGTGVLGLLSAILVVAIGDAFRSGADQALLYRTCVAIDREPEFQKIESRSRGLQLVALVGLILAGGAIVEAWGFAAGWLAETTVSAIGLALAWAIVEPPPTADAPPATTDGSPAAADNPFLGDRRSPDEQRCLGDHAASSVAVHKAAGASARRSSVALPALIWLIAPAALLEGIGCAASFLAQTREGVEAARMTALVAVITLAEAGGAAVAAFLPARRGSQLVLLAAGLLVTGAAAVLPSAFLPAVVALSFLMGVAEPLRAAAIQRLAADHVRARAASIASACDRAMVTIALVCAGRLSRRD